MSATNSGLFAIKKHERVYLPNSGVIFNSADPPPNA